MKAERKGLTRRFVFRDGLDTEKETLYGSVY